MDFLRVQGTTRSAIIRLLNYHVCLCELCLLPNSICVWLRLTSFGTVCSYRFIFPI